MNKNLSKKNASAELSATLKPKIVIEVGFYNYFNVSIYAVTVLITITNHVLQAYIAQIVGIKSCYLLVLFLCLIFFKKMF